MSRKVLKYLVIPVMSFLLFGIFIQHLIAKPKVPKKLLCNEGSLLSQVDGTGTVYTKVSGLSCIYDKGLLVISDKNNIAAMSLN